MKKYITTPIYYVNDKPHLGSAYTTIACDVWARFQRFLGNDTFFLTGTDEHGQKIQQAADKAKKDPQDFVDDVSLTFRNMMNHLLITNDDFIRTTEERHKKAAQYLWTKLEANGHIYAGDYAGWYAVRDEAFYKEEELVNGKAPTGAEVTWVVEKSYFFKLSTFQDKLLALYENNPNFIQPASRLNEVLSFVKSGLHDLSISRSSFAWGIPLPMQTAENETQSQHVMYVWIDALTNYLTAVGYPDNLDTERFSQAIHVVGKDILRFHAVYWPAFLMAADLPLPKQIYAHGWWTVEGEKMSKSLGNTVDPIKLTDDYGLDSVRNFVLREMPFGQDGNFSYDSFLNRTNAELANAYGNLVQRVLSFVQKNAEGKIPEAGNLEVSDLNLIDRINHILPTLTQHIDELKFHKYAEEIWLIIFECNAYVDHQKPWDLKKRDTHRMNTVLYTLCESIRKIALMTQSLLPIGSEKILDYLAVDKNNRGIEALDHKLTTGTPLPNPSGIYPRFSA
jgi:methionyl-tRNA synthetase